MRNAIHRLSLDRRRPMDEMTPLLEFQDRYIASHRARNHSEKTVERYRSTFKDFARFLALTKRADHLGSLDTATLRAFGVWLRETPTRPCRFARAPRS
jgi:site-specific recombinase XerD